MENIFMIIKDKNEFFEALNEWEASKKPTGKPEKKDPDEVYLSQREAARFLRVSLPTLISWKKTITERDQLSNCPKSIKIINKERSDNTELHDFYGKQIKSLKLIVGEND